MVTAYAVAGEKLRVLEAGDPVDPAVWIDLLRPEPHEEKALEQVLAIDIPTREEMSEIEISSRLYLEGGTPFMTALVLSAADPDHPMLAPVTFILVGQRLLTVRYDEPPVFHAFAGRVQKAEIGCTTADGTLLALLEAIVDRLADVLEATGRDADALSAEVFASGEGPGPGFQAVLERIGRQAGLASMCRDSLTTLERLVAFLGAVAGERGSDHEVRGRIKTLARDAQSLGEHVAYLSQKLGFLLEATLGLINIEQNAIIKIFSVAAVVFLPPTLVASVYGMNFRQMPELGWPFGYPLAIALMVASAVFPLLFFKRRGWL